MKLAPLIHSRTLHCDFNSNFAVRPSDLNVNWAMKKILLAMRDTDILNGVRHLVASDGKICIAGVACNLRYFAEKYLDDAEAKNYFHDERGREVKIFLGFAFKGGSQNEIPDVNYSTLWKFFKETLAPEWEREVVETVIVDYKTCSTKKINPTNLEKFSVSDESTDEKLFAQCMAARKNLCTNADQMKIINSGEFEIISTTQSLINRFKSEAEKKTSPPPKSSSPSTSMQPNIPPRSKPTQKDSNSKLPIIAAAVVIIAVILFLLMK